MTKSKVILKSGVYKLVRRVPVLNGFAKKVKLSLIQNLDAARARREIYDKNIFYPTIPEYFYQTRDSVNKSGPLVSILLPTYNTPIEYLKDCIESIILQSYPNWELCIADDASTDGDVVKIIKEYQLQDKRIKLIERKKNGHISLASNSALDLATGEYVALMDHDDVLWPNALFEFVKVIHEKPDIDFIYSDEDKLDGSGKIHSYPFLKPSYSPEFLESCNYITHFSCIKTDLIKKVGGFRKGYEGAQDWDLFIRITEVTNKIHHISKILYSWRIHEDSTASNTDAKPYVYAAQLALLNDHVERTGKEGIVEKGIITQHRTIKYKPQKDSELTALIDCKDSSKEEVDKTVNSLSKEMELKNIFFVESKKIDSTVSFPSTVEALKNVKTNTILSIKAGVELTVSGWLSAGVADSEIDGVACVFPVLLNNSGTILSAGVGVGYGQGLMDMLQGSDMEDQHYTRGLYAKSRRNVTCGNSSVFFCSKIIASKIYENEDPYKQFIELSDNKYRHIYNPFISASIDSLPALAPRPEYLDYDDRYLNSKFKHENQNMEVVG